MFVDGLSGDPQCALSTARFTLAGQRIDQTTGIDDLDELCGVTTCAQLVDLATISISGHNVAVSIVNCTVNLWQHHKTINL